MKFIRLMFISVLSLFLVITAISLFIPAHVRISRAVNVNTNADSILDHIHDLSRWKYWYPGFEKIQFDDSVISSGKTIKATIHDINLDIQQANDSLVLVQMLKGKRHVYATWRIIHYKDKALVTIQHYKDFTYRWYPWEKFSSLLLEKTYGPVMEEGLTNLKQLY